MDSENPPTLPDAHQQIRLGDIQASAQKWTAAIEYYSRAIEYFKTIQNTLHDASLISILQAQIVQCEKTIHYCRLKDRSEQALKVEYCSKLARAHSVSNIKPPIKVNGKMVRNNTMQLQNRTDSDGHGGMDSLAGMLFPNTRRNTIETKNQLPPIAKKKSKNDSQKMEELQISNEEMKKYLRAALEDIDRLKNENKVLREQKEPNALQSQVVFDLLSTDREDSDEQNEESENELEATM